MPRFIKELLSMFQSHYSRNGQIMSCKIQNNETPKEGTKDWPRKNVIKGIIHRPNDHLTEDESPQPAHSPIYSLCESWGGYPILSQLNHRGNVTVFLGWHHSLDIPVVIKVIKLGISCQRQSALEGARREAHIGARIDHANIVRVFDCGEDKDHGFFIIMEAMRLKDLMSLMREQAQKKFTIDFALYAIISVTEALTKAYRENVIHRDIKPHNILVNTEGMVKLADLGLAKACDQSFDLTQTGSSKGTPFYMAPEQAEDAKHVDHRADIYALGITFYQLITGEVPFNGKDTDQITKKKKIGNYKPAEVLEPSLDKTVSHIIRKMIASKVEARYETPDELLKDLKEYQATRKSNLSQVIASVINSLPSDYPIVFPDFDLKRWQDGSHQHHQVAQTPASQVQHPGSLGENQTTDSQGKLKTQLAVTLNRIFLIAIALLFISGMLYLGLSRTLGQPENRDHELKPLLATAAKQARRTLESFNPKTPLDKLCPEFKQKTEGILAAANGFFVQGSFSPAFTKYQELWQLIQMLQGLDISFSQCEREQESIQKLISTIESLFPEIQKTKGWQKTYMVHKDAFSLFNDRRFGDAFLKLKECKASYNDLVHDALQAYQEKAEKALTSLEKTRTIYRNAGVLPEHWSEVDDLVQRARLAYEGHDFKANVELWKQALMAFSRANESAAATIEANPITAKEVSQTVDDLDVRPEELKFENAEVLTGVIDPFVQNNSPVVAKSNTIPIPNKTGSQNGKLQNQSGTLTNPIQTGGKPSIQCPTILNRNFPNNNIDMTLTTANGKSEFVEGDHFSLVIRAKVDCHIAVFAHSPDDDLVILFPNFYNSDTQIPAHQFVSIPDRVGELNKSGFKFTVKPPFGQECMEVIACTDPYKLAEIINGKTPITRSPFSSIKRSILDINLRKIGVEEDKQTKNEDENAHVKWGKTTLTIKTKAKE